METKIIVVGIGPGSADYILPAAQKMIAAAHYLVGGKRALADFAGPHQSTQVIDRDIPAVLRFVSDALQNHDVVVMVSGDPGFHSFLTRLRTVFGTERLTVIPGVSSLQVAFARLAMPWQEAAFLSLHGNEESEAALAYNPRRVIGLLLDNKMHAAAAARKLLDHGWPPTAFAGVCANLSYPDECVWRGTLTDALKLAPQTMCVMVVAG